MAEVPSDPLASPGPALSEPLLDPAAEDPALEDGEPETYPRLAVVTLGLVTLCDAIEYGVVMPSLYTYIGEVAQGALSTEQVQHVFGVALAIFSAASLCVKPVLGAATDKLNYRPVYAASILVAVAGNLMYASALRFGRLELILAGRALSGVGCANTALGFSYVSRVVPKRYRTQAMTALGMAFPLGLVLGPACNALTAAADFTVYGFRVTPDNSPGLFVAAILALLLVALLATLPEPPPYGPGHRALAGGGCCAAARDVAIEVRKPAVLKCFAAIFFFNLFITSTEAIVVPVTKHAFGFTTFQNSLVYGAIAVEVIVLSAVVMAVSPRVGDDILIICALCSGALGIGCVLWLWTYAMPLWHFAIAEGVMLIAIPLALSPNRSRFSKVVGQSRLQGLLNALLGSVASVAGIVGPIYASSLIGEPTPNGPVGRRMFAGLAGMGGLLLLWEALSLAAKAVPWGAARDEASIS